MTKKIALYLLIALLTASCNDTENPGGSTGGDQSLTEGITAADPEVLSSLALTFDANIQFINFTSTDQEKMDRAIEIIKLVVATEEFKSRVLNHSYNGSKTYVDNGGLTNAQIYQKILEGAERLQPVKNNTMDAEVELYYATTNVVGYTYPTSKRIWVNTKYFNTYTAAGVAHNLFHEWMHKLGFTHASTWSIARDYSVPYALGNLVGELGKDFL